MEITGKIIASLPEAGGVSKAGNTWKKKEYVLETQETYPRKVCFNFFGDKCDQYPLQIGQLVTVSFDLESREFNGRWYTDVRAWKAETTADGAAQQAPMVAPAPMSAPAPMAGSPVPPPPVVPQAGATDDLPF
jgi:hypothetical protein